MIDNKKIILKIFFSIKNLKKKSLNKDILNWSVSVRNLYMNDKYIFIIIANDKPLNKLDNILKLRNKTKLRKNIYF